MGKSSKMQMFGAVSVTFMLTIPLIFTIFSTSFGNPFHLWKLSDVEAGGSLKFLLGRLVRGEERTRLNATGFSCHSDLHSELCLANNPVHVDNKALTVYSPSYQKTEESKVMIQPYPRKEDGTAMKAVSQVQILHGNMNLPACEISHNVPAVIFSSGGFTGNVFHEFNEVVIPLFITCRHFRSRLQFVITDYKPWWVMKYKSVLTHLSNYKPINPAEDGSVHCFPGAVIGLRYHDNLAINSTNIPEGYSIFDFKQFLRESYNLKIKNLKQNKHKPTVILISRRKTRVILNEDELKKNMEEMGFQIVVVTTREMSNLDKFAGMVNSCSVMVGAHGAGLTNAVFLPSGAVLVQVVPLGLEWASTSYYNDPLIKMGVQYLEYKIEPEESSLFDKYGPNHPVIADPQSIFSEGYGAARAVYVDGQNVTINLERFKETLVNILKLLRTQTSLN